MTSATLYRATAQNVTLRDIDTFRMEHHVQACFHRRLKILFLSMTETYSKQCIVVEKGPNKITVKFTSLIIFQKRFCWRRYTFKNFERLRNKCYYEL